MKPKQKEKLRTNWRETDGKYLIRRWQDGVGLKGTEATQNPDPDPRNRRGWRRRGEKRARTVDAGADADPRRADSGD